MGVCGEAAILQLLHLGNKNGENDEYDNCQFTWSPGVCCTVWSPWVTVQCREEAGSLARPASCTIYSAQFTLQNLLWTIRDGCACAPCAKPIDRDKMSAPMQPSTDAALCPGTSAQEGQYPLGLPSDRTCSPFVST